MPKAFVVKDSLLQGLWMHSRGWNPSGSDNRFRLSQPKLFDVSAFRVCIMISQGLLKEFFSSSFNHFLGVCSLRKKQSDVWLTSYKAMVNASGCILRPKTVVALSKNRNMLAERDFNMKPTTQWQTDRILYVDEFKAQNP